MKINVQLVRCQNFYNKANGFHLFQLNIDLSARRETKDIQSISTDLLINKKKK